MAYTALKPCSFAGNRYKIGEIVPDEVIQPGAEKNLVKMGVLALQEGTQPRNTAPKAAEIVSVSVKTEEGTIPLEITKDGLQGIVDVLTSKVGEAGEAVSQITDNDALILLHLADSRKTIKEAAESRAKELAGGEA